MHNLIVAIDGFVAVVAGGLFVAVGTVIVGTVKEVLRGEHDVID